MGRFCGVVSGSTTLTYTLQLGLVAWDSLNMIWLSCKAYSQLRRHLPLSLNEHMTAGDIPLHQSAMFRNEQGYWYYSNRLVKEGFGTVDDLLHSPWQLGLIPPSALSSYSQHSQTISTADSNSSSIWWASIILQGSPRTLFPIILASQETSGRQPVEVWRAFYKLIVPRSSKGFMRERVWAKLKVGEKLKSWLPRQHHCHWCGEVEIVPHALCKCKFL